MANPNQTNILINVNGNRSKPLYKCIYFNRSNIINYNVQCSYVRKCASQCGNLTCHVIVTYK